MRESDSPQQNFREPWEAQAFALSVHLRDRGLFSAQEWAQALGAELANAGAHDTPEAYYQHCLNALEKLVIAKGAASTEALAHIKDLWQAAAAATPHGNPVQLAVHLGPEHHHDHE